MALIRTLFWFAIFIGSTFVFTVLFEHGPMNFKENSKKEAESRAWATVNKESGGGKLSGSGRKKRAK